MSQITRFRDGLGFRDISTSKEGEKSHATDVTQQFTKEVNFIAKALDIPVKCVRICDHPVGEYAIFVRQDASDVWFGYLDHEFYIGMDKGVFPLQQ